MEVKSDDTRSASGREEAGEKASFSLEGGHAAAPEGEALSVWTPDGAQPTAPAGDGIVSEDAVIEAIATVYDPEIPVNIYELGLIYAIDLHDDGSVKIEMTLTAPNCPSAQELPAQVKEAVEKIDTVTSATVEIVWEPPWEMSRMSEDARLTLNMF